MKDYLPQFIPHPPSKCIKRQESAELAELMRQFEQSGGKVDKVGKTPVNEIVVNGGKCVHRMTDKLDFKKERKNGRTD